MLVDLTKDKPKQDLKEGIAALTKFTETFPKGTEIGDEIAKVLARASSDPDETLAKDTKQLSTGAVLPLAFPFLSPLPSQFVSHLTFDIQSSSHYLTLFLCIVQTRKIIQVLASQLKEIKIIKKKVQDKAKAQWETEQAEEGEGKVAAAETEEKTEA